MNPTALCPSLLPLTGIHGVAQGQVIKKLDFSSQLTVSLLILLFEANLDLHWLEK